jgi:hypothetical protein
LLAVSAATPVDHGDPLHVFARPPRSSAPGSRHIRSGLSKRPSFFLPLSTRATVGVGDPRRGGIIAWAGRPLLVRMWANRRLDVWSRRRPLAAEEQGDDRHEPDERRPRRSAPRRGEGGGSPRPPVARRSGAVAIA